MSRSLPVRMTRGLQDAELRPDDVGRPLHPPPARGADDLLRPGAGSARARAARRPRRRPARRPQAPARRRHRRHAYAEAVGVYLAFSVARPPTTGHDLFRGTSQGRSPIEYVWTASHPDDLGLRRGNVLAESWRALFHAPASSGREVLDHLRRSGGAHGHVACTARCAEQDISRPIASSPPTRPTTTTSATPTCRTSSTSGCVVRCDPSSPTSSPRSPCPKPRNWSPRPTATAARRRPRPSSSTA
jgi:hypothetical protein